MNLFAAYKLSINQRKIILLGMEGKAISPSDIRHALNTDDLLVYNTEVTELRAKGFLEEVRTSAQAKKIAYNEKRPKNQIARFKVVVPK